MTIDERYDTTAGQAEGDGSRSALASLVPDRASQRAVLVLGVAILAAVAGFAVGDRQPPVPAPDSVDAGFLQDMASHHEQALQLSNLLLTKGSEADIAVFAREILVFQGYEMGLMDRQLDLWGYRLEDRPERAMGWMGEGVPVDQMPGMATDAEIEALSRATGRAADALFVDLIQEHHRGGVHMASYAADHAREPFVRALAQRMANNQAVEIAELEAARERAGLPDAPTPSGGADHDSGSG